jgi:hypothetical protein
MEQRGNDQNSLVSNKFSLRVERDILRGHLLSAGNWNVNQVGYETYGTIHLAESLIFLFSPSLAYRV